MINNTLRAMAAVAIGCAVFGFGMPVAQAQGDPVTWDCLGHPQVRPGEMTLACADNGEYLKQIHWTAWRPWHAAGTAVVWQNLCQPNCAAGNYVHGPGTVVLSDYNPARNDFGKATVTDSRGRVTTWPLTVQQD